MTELAGLLISFSFFVGVFLGRWLGSRGNRQAKGSTGFPPSDFDIPCPPCKPPRPEPPTMAELAREEARAYINLYCAERLPELFDAALDEIEEAKAKGELNCTLIHGLGMSRKERTLQGRLASLLEDNGFKALMFQPAPCVKDALVKEGEMLICW